MENKKNMLKKYKFIFMIFLCFVLCFNIVNANYYWSQEANANYESSTSGNNYIAYGSNYINPVNMSYNSTGFNYTQDGYNYTMCPITKSDFTPISADFNGNGILDVVVTDLSSNTLNIYDTNCNLIESIYVEGIKYENDSATNITHRQNIVAMPVLYDVNTDCIDNSDPMYPIFSLCDSYSPSIFVLTDESLIGYSYSLTSGGFEKSYYSNYQNECDALQWLVCPQKDGYGKCLGLGLAEQHTIIFSMLNPDDPTLITYELNTYSGQEDYLHYLKYTGLSNTRMSTSLGEMYVPYGYLSYLSDGQVTTSRQLLNDWGEKIISYGTQGSAPAVTYYPISCNDYVAKQGTLFRIFERIKSDPYDGGGGSTQIRTTIHDLSGNLLFNGGSGSNWAVVDYDKDGSNEACYLKNSQLLCYDSNLVLESTGNYTGDVSDDYNIVLADFYPSYGGESVVGKGDLCIGSVEGIFCEGEQVFDTTKTGDGYPISVFKDIYSRTPTLIYTDDSQGFIISADIDLNSCGDGICQYWENCLSCPEDGCCEEYIPETPFEEEGEYSVGTHCTSDDDCAGNLVCEYGVCSLAGFNVECLTNAECLSGECLNGYCSKPSLWDLIEASKNQQMGDDTNTNNFISLFLIIGIASAVGIYLNIWGGIMILFGLGVFFTLAGWLSAFILVGFFIVGAISLFFGMMLKGVGGQ